jgi:hypothetical protein
LTGKYKPGQPLPAGSRFANNTNTSMQIVYSDQALVLCSGWSRLPRVPVSVCGTSRLRGCCDAAK